MPEKAERAIMYREERENGLTYREIARKYGVSHQRVAQACSKYNPNLFRFHKETSFAYPNLCKWLNDNKISVAELVRRMGLETCANNYLRVRSIFSGKTEPRKRTIDKLISITGMPYEVLFSEEGE